MSSLTAHCICLRGKDARRKQMEESLQRIGVSYQIHVFDKHSDPTEGCFNSHMHLCRYALHHDMPWIWICEDNLCLSSSLFGTDRKRGSKGDFFAFNKRAYFAELERFLVARGRAFDVIFLGAFLLPYSTSRAVVGFPRLRSIGSNLHGATSYIISAKCCSAMVQSHPTFRGVAVDIVGTARDFSQRFVYQPLLFHRSTEPSIVNPHLALLRELWFHPALYRFCERLFFRNWLLTASLSLGCMLVLILLFAALAVARHVTAGATHKSEKRLEEKGTYFTWLLHPNVAHASPRRPTASFSTK